MNFCNRPATVRQPKPATVREAAESAAYLVAAIDSAGARQTQQTRWTESMLDAYRILRRECIEAGLMTEYEQDADGRYLLPTPVYEEEHGRRRVTA